MCRLQPGNRAATHRAITARQFAWAAAQGLNTAGDEVVAYRMDGAYADALTVSAEQVVRSQDS